MRAWQKAISSLMISVFLVTSHGPVMADEPRPEGEAGVAYMDQCCIVPNGCFLLFIMLFGAGVGTWLLMRNSSGHAHTE